MSELTGAPLANVKIYKWEPDPDGHMVPSVGELLNELEALKRQSDEVLFFRGHRRHSFKLQPSIYRDTGWIENEDILFKELVLKCPSEFSAREATFEALVRMQHYSLPTRLVDITTNPLVALFFAAQDEEHYEKEAGEVLSFRIPKREVKYYDSDTVSVIANISKRPQTFAVPHFDDDLDLFNANSEIELLIHEIRAEKPYFKPKIQPHHLESVVCVKSKLANARIVRQDGAFLLFGIDGKKGAPAHIPAEYTVNRPRLIVPAEAKVFVRKQLESLGITYGTLFPEMERVATYIKDLYSSPK
jgi:hypothetical protein